MPKNARYPLTPEEISIPGYKLYMKTGRKEDRGIAIYVSESVSAWQVEMTTIVDEALWIRMRGAKNKEILKGCVYRSPQSTKENNATLRNVLVEANSSKEAYVLMVGDLNYPKINWHTQSTRGSMETKQYKFIEAFRDFYMYHPVYHPV